MARPGALRDRFEKDRLALNEAVDELRRTWTGDSASHFWEKWHEGGAHPAPAWVMAGATATLDQFVRHQEARFLHSAAILPC